MAPADELSLRERFPAPLQFRGAERATRSPLFRPPARRPPCPPILASPDLARDHAFYRARQLERGDGGEALACWERGG